MTKQEIIDAVKSMTVVELNDLVKALEEEFGVTLSDEQAGNLKTVKDIIDVISKLV